MLDQYRQVRYREDQSLSRFLESIVKHYRLPAVAAAVVTRDSILHIGAFGIRKAGSQDSVMIGDTFCIGSCTKSMTAVVAATLVEEGALSWNTRAIDVFPEAREAVHEGFRATTLNDILSHQSGIQPYYSDNFFRVHDHLPFLTGPPKEQRRKFTIWQLGQEPSTEPGQYSYSNGGYVVAAAMMEESTGQSWEELIQERLFMPLGMHSAFIGMPYQKDNNQPWRHYDRDDNGEPVHLPVTERTIPALFNPAGTVSLSIQDFARYAMFHLRGLSGADGILGSETTRYLHEPVIESEENQYYALGWGVRWYAETKISGHSGGDQSVYATIAIDHKNLTAGVVLCNMGDEEAASACANVILEILP
jgi:CubicO group peptidase (beta-lactamase class C family)